MRLRLSKLALGDITLIHDYTVQKWDEQRAAKYVHDLWDALDEIKVTPDRWRERPQIHPGCRARVCGSHLIIYRVKPASWRSAASCMERWTHAGMCSPTSWEDSRTRALPVRPGALRV